MGSADDIIDGPYEHFLSDVLTQMSRHECTFKRGLELLEFPDEAAGLPRSAAEDTMFDELIFPTGDASSKGQQQTNGGPKDSSPKRADVTLRGLGSRPSSGNQFSAI